jgi:hypothetical protein
MAIDSREKRAMAIAAGIPFIVITPLADGTISAADRQQLADVYPGVSVGAEQPSQGDNIIGMARMIRTIRSIFLPYDSMYEV